MLEFLNSTLGIVASIIAIIGVGPAIIFVIKKTKQKTDHGGIASDSGRDAANMSGGSQAGTLNIIGNNNVVNPSSPAPSGNEQEIERVVDLKGVCQILFIDDDKVPSVIKPLKKSGWQNVKKIGDTANLDAPEIRNADIVFVDILGVGKALQFKNEGVGLAAAIKRRYPKKGVVIYSATSEHNLFDPDIDVLDGRLEKFAEPIQFSNMIEKYGRPEN